MQLDLGTWCRFTVWMIIGMSEHHLLCFRFNDAFVYRTFISSPPLFYHPGFAIYFFYGIRNSSESANGSSQCKYEPALQNKSPIYKGAADDSDVEAGSSPS